MPWRPLPRIAFAIAVYPFAPSAPADLPLELGDELYIIEEGGVDGAWLRGYLVAPPSLLSGLTSTKGQTLEARVFSGIFPRSCVEIREYIGGEADGDGNSVITREGSLRAGNGGKVHGAYDRLGDTAPSAVPTALPGPALRQASLQQSMADAHRAQTNGAHPINASMAASSTAPTVPSPGAEARERGSSITELSTPISVTPREGKMPRPPAPVPMLKIGDETPTCANEPLVDEIASCLREWHSTNLHELLLSREYGKLAKLTRLMNRLDMARRQLLHGVLTSQELEDLHEKIVWDMVKGNKLVNNEIIVRDPKERGRLLTATDSVLQITKLSANMALLDAPTKPALEVINLHHLLVEVTDVLKNVQGPQPSLFVAIYRKASGETPVRLTESFAAEAPQADKKNPNKLRTLFNDLTQLDVGELTGSDAELYLVVKVQASVEIKVAAPQGLTRAPTGRQPSNPVEVKSPGSDPASKEGGFNRAGRRSLLWGANKLNNARKRVIPPATIEEAPTQLVQQITKDSQRPSTAARIDEGVAQNGQQGQATTAQVPSAKRDIGVAVLRLREVFAATENTQSEHTVAVYSPSENASPREPDNEDWNPVITEIMESPSGRFEECSSVTHVQMKLQSFVAPEVDELIRTTPTALLNIHKTPRIGFPGAPKEPRSDIYVTITKPVLPSNATYAHPQRGSVQIPDEVERQNLQLTLEIRKNNGERMDHCIFPTSNSSGVTAWRTTAIQRGGAWKQTIKLAIPPEDVPSCHIIMSIADAPNFPFALAWMPLWEHHAFIQDGPHMPLLYLYDKVTSRQEDGRGAYLDMQWDSRSEEAGKSYSKESASTLRIETFLCSTELTQDQVLLGLLKFRDQNGERLHTILKSLQFVQDVELVKLSTEVWYALFTILTEHAGLEDYEDLVINNLVLLCGIMRDRRFNKDVVVAKYVDDVFDFSQVSIPIVRGLQRLFERAERNKDYQLARYLNSTIKSGRILMHIVTQSYKLQLEQMAPAEEAMKNFAQDFVLEIRHLFQSFESLMRSPSSTLIGSKSLLMHHVSEWVSVLRRVLPKRTLWTMAQSFIDSTAGVQGKLSIRRLATILDFCKVLDSGEDPETEQDVDKTLLETKIFDWISPYWGATTEINEQYREQVRLCTSIVAQRSLQWGELRDRHDTKLIDSFMCLRDAGRPANRTHFSPLFPQSYPFVTRPLYAENPINEALIEITATLAKYDGKILTPETHTPERVILAFEVMQSIVDGRAYPKSWLTLSLYHHRVCLVSCQRLFNHMQKYMLPEPEQPEQFRTDLWKSLFTTLLSIVSSENLALETFPEQKRRAVWKIAGDVREVGAGLLARCWNAIGWEVNKAEREQYGLERLGGWQVQYVPLLVGPIVELCLSVHAGLRATAVQIMQSMIISEWSINGDLGVIQHEIVECLNYLLKHKNMAENAQQKLFVIELMDLFEPLAETNDNELWEAFKDLISVVEDLLDLLVVVHSPDTSDAFRTMNTLRLMDFLRDMQKQDIFISYVHQLADTEAQARCFKEAGLALRLHAELYDWDTNKTTEALTNPLFPSQSCFERRERLYFEMIRHFEDGGAYGCALECYRELADHYEHTSFDFAKLARTQRSMAKCYELIAKGEGQIPRYFKVVYKGLGFPPNLRDKQYIFEGNGSERLVNFTDRLQREHPSARVASSGENTDGEGQYLHVTPVTPYRDLKHPLYQRSKVGFATKEYVLSDSPVNFAVTTRRHSPKTGVREQWVEKTVYTTAEVFPTILRRSEVIAEEILPLSPIQTAIERTVRKASELWTLEKRVREGDETSKFNLVDAIKTSVDLNSSTSVAQYRDMLPRTDARDSDSDDDDEDDGKKTAEDAMQAALRIALFDFTYMLRHCFNTFGRHMPTSDYQRLLAQFQTTFAPEIALLAPLSNATAQESVNPLQFSDPTFQVMPPTPTKAFTADAGQQSPSEAQDTVPASTSRMRNILSADSRGQSRGNRLSMLLKRKPSTANSSDAEPSGSAGNPSVSKDRSFNIRKITTGATNSSTNVNEREPPRTADVQSNQSSQPASKLRSPKKSPHQQEASSPGGDGDRGGPVYTPITAAARDAFKPGGYTASGAGSIKLSREGQRPLTSHSNGTVTTTGRRLAELRKGLAARKLRDGEGAVDGSTDVMGVRVDMIQRRYARKNAAQGSCQQLGPMEFINMQRIGLH